MSSWFSRLINRKKVKSVKQKEDDTLVSYRKKVAIIQDKPQSAAQLVSEFTDAELQHHAPQQELVQVRETDFKPMTAADLSKFNTNLTAAVRQKKLSTFTSRQLFINPMQSLDYRVYEPLFKHTFVGAALDAFTKFVMGDSFHPELELIRPGEDQAENQRLLEENREIIENLEEIDRQVSSPSGDKYESMDIPFQQKIGAMISSCLCYNRGALIFRYDGKNPVEINGEKYREIPTDLVFAHARDLNMIQTDPVTRRLMGVQWFDDSADMVPVKDMIYLWNPMVSAKVYNSWHYGISAVAPLMSAARIISVLLREDFPAIAKSAWAGYWFLIAKNEGSTEEEKRNEFRDFTNTLVPGKAAVIIKDPEDVEVHNVDLNPQTDELRELLESMIKLCISTLGLPQIGFYDEAASNRDTAVSKIQLTMQTNIAPVRKVIGEIIAQQWYDRWFRLIYADDKEKLEKFKIRIAWKDVQITEWYDNMESALKLDMRKPLTDKAFGGLIGRDGYENMIDTEKAEKMEEFEEKQRSLATEMGIGMMNIGKPGQGGPTGDGSMKQKPGKQPSMPFGKAASGGGKPNKPIKQFGRLRQ